MTQPPSPLTEDAIERKPTTKKPKIAMEFILIEECGLFVRKMSKNGEVVMKKIGGSLKHINRSVLGV